MLLLIAAVVAYHAASLDSPKPSVSLVCSPAVYDFGVVTRGELVGHFTFTNKADEPIQILHVLVSCTCQKVDVPRARLEPGESVQGNFRWDARSEQEESRSHFRVVYRVDTEKSMRYLKCVSRAKVLAPFEFQPREVTFSSVRKEVQTAVIHFWASEGSEFALEGAECRHPSLSARCIAEESEVVVTFDPSRWHKDDLTAKSSVRILASNDPGKGYTIPIRILK